MLGKNRRRGAPFEPTQQQRDNVKLMAGLDIRAEEIAKTVIDQRTGKSISEATLRRAFKHELETGKIELTALIGNVLVNTALGRTPSVGEPIKGDQARLNAVMFYLKARGGWREGYEVDHVGKHGEPIQHTVDHTARVIDDIKRVRERLLASAVDGAAAGADGAGDPALDAGNGGVLQDD